MAGHCLARRKGAGRRHRVAQAPESALRPIEAGSPKGRYGSRTFRRLRGRQARHGRLWLWTLGGGADGASERPVGCGSAVLCRAELCRTPGAWCFPPARPLKGAWGRGGRTHPTPYRVEQRVTGGQVFPGAFPSVPHRFRGVSLRVSVGGGSGPGKADSDT